MVEFLHVERWEKWNRTNLYWGVVKECVGSIQYCGIKTFCVEVLKHFEFEIYKYFELYQVFIYV